MYLQMLILFSDVQVDVDEISSARRSIANRLNQYNIDKKLNMVYDAKAYVWFILVFTREKC